MLADPFEQLRDALLTGLDLTDEQVEYASALDGTLWERFQEVWAELEAEHRLSLLARLGEAAEEHLRFDFTRIYRLALDDVDPALRELAVRLASEAPGLELLDQFVELATTDPNSDVRVAAIEELGAFTFEAQMDDWPAEAQRRMESLLRLALHDPEADSATRRSALLSLAYLMTDEVESEIRWARLQPDLQAAAVEAMGRNCQEIWLSEVAAELASDDARVQVAATRAAAELEDERLVEPLLSQLRGPDLDEEVRFGAITALGIIGGHQAKDALSELLQSRNRRVRDAAREALDELLFMDDPLPL